MDPESRKFLSKHIYCKCPNCNATISLTLKDLGKMIKCKKCSFVILVGKKFILDSDTDEEFAKDIEEFLAEIKNQVD